jgi:ferric iron reductase protein FhuF
MTASSESPLVSIYSSLAALDVRWGVVIGTPQGAGWLRGTDLLRPAEGPFNPLLNEIGSRAATRDRTMVAAGFALRYAQSSAMAIAPYLVHHCVPHISLENVSFKFSERTSFERAALYEPRGVMVRRSGWLPNGHVDAVANEGVLLRRLREALGEQAGAVVQALQAWSQISIRDLWGLVTSSWASQLETILERLGREDRILDVVRQFFAGDDVIADMQPELYPVIFNNVTRIVHRQTSCCRYYLLPDSTYCATCPLISAGDRASRDRPSIERPLGV